MLKNIYIFVLLFVFFATNIYLKFLNYYEDIKFREGNIRYISKPTIISLPFILLSTNERFYITNEIYNNLIQNLDNRYYYFKIVNNIVYEINEKPFENYVYDFPNIFKVNSFEFKDYNILYILLYYNLSKFVSIEAKSDNNEKLFVYFTSSNSFSIKIPKNKTPKLIKVILTYINTDIKNLKFQKEYTIKYDEVIKYSNSK